MDKRAKILLIDDDPDFLESIRIVLETKYEVVTALSGDEGLQKASSEKPDLILLDIIMPVTDGFTVAEHLKRDVQLSRIPVLMLTSFAQRVGETSIPRSRGFELEAEDYLDKPVAPEELLKRVDSWLKKSGR
jgi:DNA-binding response OmpR family regulator